MNNAMPDDPKPCPWPGCDAFTDPHSTDDSEAWGGGDAYYVECGCGMHGPTARSRAEAICRWNELPRERREENDD